MQAAIASMRNLVGAVIATSLVLMAVFVPVGFFPGTAGQLYQQFALTIAFAIALSTFNALTLTPALSALLLRTQPRQTGALGWIYRRINGFLTGLERSYHWGLGRLMRWQSAVLVGFVGLLVATGWLYTQVPQAFLPEEDQGYFISILQGPDGTSLNYTEQVVAQAEQQFAGGAGARGHLCHGRGGLQRQHPQPGHSVCAAQILAGAAAAGAVGDGHSQPGADGRSMGIPQAPVIAVNPPTIPSLGSVGGFVFQLQDRDSSTSDINELDQMKGAILAKANQTPGLQGVFSLYTANAPQLQVEVNRDRAEALQVPVEEIFSTLQTYLGSRYVNDFNAFGRTYRVYVQADATLPRRPRQHWGNCMCDRNRAK